MKELRLQALNAKVTVYDNAAQVCTSRVNIVAVTLHAEVEMTQDNSQEMCLQTHLLLRHSETRLYLCVIDYLYIISK